MHYKLFVITILILFFSLPVRAQSQGKAKPVPFIYLPESSDDPYNQRLKQKTIALNETDFVILSKKSATAYSIERHNQSLHKTWSAQFELQTGEEVVAFSKNQDVAYILTNKPDAGYQQLKAYAANLSNGKKALPVIMFEAPAKPRKIGVSISDDGSKIVAYQYFMLEATVRAIGAEVFDGRFQKIKSQNYNFREYATNPSVQIRIDNAGNQYVCLLTDYFTKLTIRKYSNTTDDIKVMSVPVGGSFDGKDIYVFQTSYLLTQTGTLYASALCIDKGTSDYYSLKLVECDFGVSEMRFAPEYKFTPEYLTVLNKHNVTGKPITRLDDIELTQMLLTPDKDLILIAEKRYQEPGDMPQFVAQELHLFAYDEYLNLAWRSILMKNQVAPAEVGYSGISYKANLSPAGLHILTLENLNGKTDVHLRQITTRSGATEPPKALGLTLSKETSGAYLKDFTAWLTGKTIIAVTKPSKKSPGLVLNKINIR